MNHSQLLKNVILTVICMLAISATAISAPVIIPIAPSEGVTTDLFDVSQGTIVTAASSQCSYINTGTADPRSAFGYSHPGFIEPTREIFNDQANTPVDYIDFQTAQPISFGSYVLTLGANTAVAGENRWAKAVRLYASNNAVDVQTHLVSSVTIDGPYVQTYGSDTLEVRDTLNLSNVQFFRIELERGVFTGFDGPRLIELDGFAVPEPSSVVLFSLGAMGLFFVARRRRAVTVIIDRACFIFANRPTFGSRLMSRIIPIIMLCGSIAFGSNAMGVVVPACDYGTNYFWFDAHQAGSTSTMDDLVVRDLNTNTVVYSNDFSTDLTGLTTWFRADVGQNFVSDSPMISIVGGQLRLESTGFGANGAGGYNSLAGVVLDQKLPENFEITFITQRLQWAGQSDTFFFANSPYFPAENADWNYLANWGMTAKTRFEGSWGWDIETASPPHAWQIIGVNALNVTNVKYVKQGDTLSYYINGGLVDTATLECVPEPTTLALAGIGLLCLACVKRRRL